MTRFPYIQSCHQSFYFFIKLLFQPLATFPGNLLCTIFVELLRWKVFCVCKHRTGFFYHVLFYSMASTKMSFVQTFPSGCFLQLWLFPILMKHSILDTRLLHSYIFDSLVSIFIKVNARINICAYLFLKPSFC